MAYSISEKCIGCTMCSRLCPVYAITGDRKQRHVINEKRCVECGVCGKACPQGAITDSHGDVIAAVPKSNWAKPVIDATLCSACRMCIQVCRAGAIEITMPESPVDVNSVAYLANPKKCVGCGLCASECPLDAITISEVEL